MSALWLHVDFFRWSVANFWQVWPIIMYSVNISCFSNIHFVAADIQSAAALRKIFISSLRIHVQIFSMTNEWKWNPIALNKPAPASAKIIPLTSIFFSHHNTSSPCLLCCLVPAEHLSFPLRRNLSKNCRTTFKWPFNLCDWSSNTPVQSDEQSNLTVKKRAVVSSQVFKSSKSWC